MEEITENPVLPDGDDALQDPVHVDVMRDPHAIHINAQLVEFRKQLLALTLRNQLLDCQHGPRVVAQVRVVDELPNAVFQRLEGGDEYTFLPLPEPRDMPDDEDSDEFRERLTEHKEKSTIYQAAVAEISTRKDKEAALARAEREARDHVRLLLGLGVWEPEHGLSPEDLCRRRGIDPSYELPLSDIAEFAERHHDNALQTLLPDELLATCLGRLRDRARSSISQTGVGTLFAAFGFLEWFESDDSDVPHHAPLILVPAELGRRLQQGRYHYRFGSTGEEATANVTLAVHLRQHFGLELPKLGTDDSPESYFARVTDEICAHRRRWRVRRFLTIGIFAYSKLAIYEDLNPELWPTGQELAAHENIRTLMAQSGVSDVPYAENREIDEDESAAATPILIYDADSSQHSAITDVLSGKNLTIYGPPGTGKSQTIANVIAAAAMVDKTVLFVAEKLTALEVVWDRLEKAGLGPFCFNLHAQGLKSGEVRRSLGQRVNMPRPSFDPSRYEQQKDAWTKQRDGLRTYARIMGAKIGRLGETVHDILWRTIERKNSEAHLPPAIAAVLLSNVETTSAAEVGEARNRVKLLENTEAAARQFVGADGSFPWRGLQRADLSPIEVGPAIQLFVAWERTLTDLEHVLNENGLPGAAMTIGDVRVLLRGAEIVQRFPDAAASCDLASLTRLDARNGIAQAVLRVHRLRHVGEELIRLYSVDIRGMPQASEVRALTADASSLGVSSLSYAATREQAKTLREQARTRDHIDDTLARLRAILNFSAELCGTDETIDRVIELLSDADNDMLSSRADSLMTREAGRILKRAETALEELKQIRDDLTLYFDLGSVSSSEELRQAARSLNALRGPLLLNKPAKRAMRLYRELALGRAKPSPTVAALDLRKLAEYLEATSRLKEDAEIAGCLGTCWRGLDSDLAPARRVIEWATVVVDKLEGEGEGRTEAREMLLHGEIQHLAEVRRIAETLPSHWRHAWSEVDPPVAREQATRLEALADRFQKLGLDEALPFSHTEDLAALVEEHQSLASEANADEILGHVFASQEPAVDALEAVRSFADAMSDLDLTDAAWAQVAEFLRAAPDAESAPRVVKEAFTLEGEAWSDCLETLQLDERIFLDGKEHETTPLPTLRERAQEGHAARESLLSWCAYQGARAAVKRSHAAPVLAAFDEHGISSTRLNEAYEWALYRSLAMVVYRRYPQLTELTSWQLSNHRAAFQRLDDDLQELERTRIAHELHSRPIEHGESFGGPSAFTEMALIQHQLSLQRSSVTVRNLMLRSGTALRQLKPCFMMSPTTVAELLPRDTELFDIVIIDEASQMLPCDALGAIARGRQAVIVGDPKQLPPSTYFQGGAVTTTDNDDEDDALAPMVESILDLSLSAWRPPRYLQWHYRSRHSSLIQFSNARFYDNRLIVFPGPDEERDASGIRYHHVTEGLYQGGLNPIEAEYVVKAAREFMADPKNRDLSLAIVAMNQRQRDHINEMLDRETAQNQKVARYERRWRNTLYPFIVRNLETVQGDERDVIFISTVYGRETPDGAVMRRFGPITHAGGERRLNVLFSRARQRMEVFSSMQANDIAVSPGISEGVRILRDYLEYAATGRIERGSDTGRGPESPFEEYVLARLQAQGLEVDPQVGVAGYRVDLGIRHPDYPHGYLLGVECDGRTYHSALSVRDRDRLREAVLRGLGWDIYRIWSTDWFKDADHEMQRLMSHIDGRIEAWHSGPAPEEDNTALLGELVEQSPDLSSDSILLTREEELGDKQLFVEVSDTVSYHNSGREFDIRRVTIVRGVDDPASGVINDNKPLARALLGAEVGETVTVRQPTSEVDIVVVDIDRSELALGEPSVLAASAPVEGIELEPYQEWQGAAPDPRSTSVQNVAETLFQIIETEGPVLESRAYLAYIRASGAQRLGPQIRRVLNRALASLERRKRVVVERTTDGGGYRNALIRVPEVGRVKVRELGPRAFEEVPLSELSLLVRRVRASESEASSEEIFRQVLSIYGLVRMTTQVKKRFEEAGGSSTP